MNRHGEKALTNAAVLLFGKNVLSFFPHCRIRYIRVNGTAMRTGADFNVIKDRNFDLPLLRLIPEGLFLTNWKNGLHLRVTADFTLILNTPNLPGWKA